MQDLQILSFRLPSLSDLVFLKLYFLNFRDTQKGHPFDIILHKVREGENQLCSFTHALRARSPKKRHCIRVLRCCLPQLPSSEARALDWERKLLDYTRLNPRVTVVDTPQACKAVRMMLSHAADSVGLCPGSRGDIFPFGAHEHHNILEWRL